MKKYPAAIVFLVILLLFTGSSLVGKGKFGIQAGVLSSNIRVQWPDGSGNLKSLTGFRLGGFFRLPILKNFSLQTGINFSTEGFQYYDAYSRQLEAIKINFIKIPFLLNAHLGKLPVEFFAGPYAAFRIGKEKYAEPISISFDENIKKRDFGLTFGVRFYFKEIFSRFPDLFIELQADLGLANFIENEWNIDKKQVQRVFAVMLGYRF